jgi:hypothetical protein
MLNTRLAPLSVAAINRHPQTNWTLFVIVRGDADAHDAGAHDAIAQDAGALGRFTNVSMTDDFGSIYLDS